MTNCTQEMEEQHKNYSNKTDESQIHQGDRLSKQTSIATIHCGQFDP